MALLAAIPALGVGVASVAIATPIHTLAEFSSGPNAGPNSVLTAMDGTLYGTTESGGASGNGTLYAYTPGGTTIQTLVDFDDADGINPIGGVIAVNGTLYGTTYTYGSGESGTLYAYDPATNTLTTLQTFNGSAAQGGGSEAPPTNVDGTLYGTTASTLYSYNLGTKTFRRLAAFGGAMNSIGPVIDLNGTLYGTTSEQTASASGGALYSYNIASGRLQTLVSFTSAPGASPPFPRGLVAIGGTLYGTTEYGGSDNAGTLFSYDPATGDFNTLVDFNGTNGGLPQAPLLAMGGALYGTTEGGGGAGLGTVFSYDPGTGSLATLASFTGNDGAAPLAGLTELGGTLYGTTYTSGTNPNAGGSGTLFSFAPVTSVPEPSELGMFGLGLLLIGGGLGWRERQRHGGRTRVAGSAANPWPEVSG